MAKASKQRFDGDSRLQIRRDQLPEGDCLCDHCVGKCCRYFSLAIETPKTWDDFDAIRWYLAHGQTLIYVDQGTWYLLVMTKCQYLLEDNRCGIYHNRPKICREYTTDECEYDEDWTFEKVFETPAQVWEYAEALLQPQPRRSAKPTGAAAIVSRIDPLPRRNDDDGA